MKHVKGWGRRGCIKINPRRNWSFLAAHCVKHIKYRIWYFWFPLSLPSDVISPDLALDGSAGRSRSRWFSRKMKLENTLDIMFCVFVYGLLCVWAGFYVVFSRAFFPIGVFLTSAWFFPWRVLGSSLLNRMWFVKPPAWLCMIVCFDV